MGSHILNICNVRQFHGRMVYFAKFYFGDDRSGENVNELELAVDNFS